MIKRPILRALIALITLNGAVPPKVPSISPESASSSEQSRRLSIIHPCTDYGFKKVMKVPQVAIGFLNHILDLKGDQRIEQVIYLSEELSSPRSLGRDFTVDVLCQAATGERFLLEMQNNFQGDYATKALVELCRMIASWDVQSIHERTTEAERLAHKSGQTFDEVKTFWKDIRRAIVVVITNKEFRSSETKKCDKQQSLMEPHAINSYCMTHTGHNGRTLGDIDMRVVLVTLANFNKKESELENDLDRWLFAFKDTSLRSGVSSIPHYKLIDDPDKAIGSTAGLKAFYSELDKSRQDRYQQAFYERQVYQLEEGMAAVKAAERRASAIQTAKRLIKRGRAIDEIIEDAGVITREEIDILTIEYQSIVASHTGAELEIAVQSWINAENDTVDQSSSPDGGAAAGSSPRRAVGSKSYTRACYQPEAKQRRQ